MMGTYMDTCEQSNKVNSCKQLKLWWARLDLNQRPDEYDSLHSIFTGFHQVILTNINSIITPLVTYIKCYQIVLNIRADRHLYGHLINWNWILLQRLTERTFYGVPTLPGLPIGKIFLSLAKQQRKSFSERRQGEWASPKGDSIESWWDSSIPISPSWGI